MLIIILYLNIILQIYIILTDVETISWWNGCQLTSRTHPLCPTKLLTILPVKTSYTEKWIQTG